LSPSVTNSAGSNGTGKPPTGGWAKPGSGGEKVGKNPTDRGKNGSKKSVLVDGDGGPLGVVIEGANVPDCKLLRATIEAIVIERPEPTTEQPQHLCLDKGYDNPTGRAAAVDAKYTPHIRRIGEEKKPCDRTKGEKPRRWVVERTLAWLSKCRGILVRYDKKDINYLGLIQLACALCWYRRLYRMGRCNANRVPT
jgi:putative transposase